MKKKNKGFTLVELVIVIAVIAILAAVLIPTFSSVIKNANNSADTQLVASLNIVAATHQATGDNGEFDSADNIRKMLAEEGIPATSLKTKNKNNVIVYNTATKQFECTALDDLVEESTSNTYPVGYYLEEFFGYKKVENGIEYKILVSTGGNDVAEAIYALHNISSATADVQKALDKIKDYDIKQKIQYILENSVFIAEDGSVVSVTSDGDKSRVIFYEKEQEFDLDTLTTEFARIIVPNNVTSVYSEQGSISTYFAGNTGVVDTDYLGIITVDNAKIGTAGQDDFVAAPLSLNSTLELDYVGKSLNWNTFKTDQSLTFYATGSNEEGQVGRSEGTLLNLISAAIEAAGENAVTLTADNIVSLTDGTNTYPGDIDEVAGGTYQLTVQVDKKQYSLLVKYKTVDVASNWYTIEDALNSVSSGTVTVKANTNFTALDVYKGEGYYTVKTGVTLFLPYSSSATTDVSSKGITMTQNGFNSNVIENRRGTTTDLGFVGVDWDNAYTSLTIVRGKTLTVANNATLIVGAKLFGRSGETSSISSANYAQLEVQEGAEIILESGATFHSLGFTFGEGLVTAENGSKVYEPFNLIGWKGGTPTSNMADTVFPFNQYTMSSIEVNTKFMSGSEYYVRTVIIAYTEKLFFKIYANVDKNVTFLSKKGSDAFIQMDTNNSDDYVIKSVNVSNGEVKFVIKGDITFDNIALDVGTTLGGSFSTKDKQVPIPGNFNINVLSGSSVTIPNSVALKMLPGSEFNIAKGATLTIKSGGGAYAYGANNVKYSNSLTAWKDGNTAYPQKNIVNVYRQSVTSMGYSGNNKTYPAKIIVNGTIVVENGGTIALEVIGNAGAIIQIAETANISGTISEDNGGGSSFFTSTITAGGQINGEWTAFEKGVTYQFDGSNWVNITEAMINTQVQLFAPTLDMVRLY